MRVFRGFRELPPAWRGAVAAIGNFDGVHRGHQAVLAAAAGLQPGGRLGLVTFEPHPRAVIRPAEAVPRLTPLRRKLEILAGLGVAQVMILPFSPRLMAMPAVAFVDEVLAGQLGLAGIACGTAFRFGHRRGGDADLLATRAAAHGIAACAIPPVLLGDAVCSSSAVRAALAGGRVAEAAGLLGRPHEILGVVRPGDRRGRELGFPTANTRPLPADTAMPVTGIYVVSARLGDDPAAPWQDAVASLGRNPTFAGTEIRLEVHLLDSGPVELYGRRLRVAFHERLRGEAHYPTVEALVAQIAKDCDQARRIHAARRSPAAPITQ